MRPDVRAAVRAGSAAVAPMLIGVVPFGLVAGASPGEQGLGWAAAIGFSTIVFAGASQLAAIDVLGGGGSVLVATLAACTINLRMLLYSASLSPHLTNVRFRDRMVMAYLLTDQAYAVSIGRWESDQKPLPKVPYYLGGALTLWSSWQVATIVGAVVGPAVPDSLPLDFAVPLVFLVLLIPTLTSSPALVAALAGGTAAVLTAQAGGGDVSILAGALVGIMAGCLAEIVAERRSSAAPDGGGAS